MAYHKKILVTGSSGNIGGAVLRALVRKGFAVRAGSTGPANIKYPEGVETVKLIYAEKESVKAAVEHVSGVYLIAPPMDPTAQELLIPLIDMAKEAGVEHIILNSSFGVESEEEDALRITELYLMNSGINYTIFRPNFIMENFSSGFIAPMIKAGGIFLSAADSKTSFVSAEDIGKSAACAFEQRLYSREFNLSGFEAVDHAEVARMISHCSGKEVRYHALTEEEMLNNAREQGMPEPSVQMFGGLYRLTRKGVMARIFDDVKTITGTAPQSFAGFAENTVWE